METFRFRNFKVYQDTKLLNLKIFHISKTFPLELRSQIIRSSLSIVLNIAEGSAKKSDKDFRRFLEIALGSANETVASLEIGVDLNLLCKEKLELLVAEIESIAKQLGGLSKKLMAN